MSSLFSSRPVFNCRKCYCSNCGGKTFHKQEAIFEHFTKLAATRLKCDWRNCGDSFGSHVQLFRHIMRVHARSLYLCPVESCWCIFSMFDTDKRFETHALKAHGIADIWGKNIISGRNDFAGSFMHVASHREFGRYSNSTYFICCKFFIRYCWFFDRNPFCSTLGMVKKFLLDASCENNRISTKKYLKLLVYLFVEEIAEVDFEAADRFLEIQEELVKTQKEEISSASDSEPSASKRMDEEIVDEGRKRVRTFPTKFMDFY